MTYRVEHCWDKTDEWAEYGTDESRSGITEVTPENFEEFIAGDIAAMERNTEWRWAVRLVDEEGNVIHERSWN